MNILYILGNGFDKAMGMATSYPEFYRYLIENVNEGSQLLERMKQSIKEDKRLWSDMEIALGEFTAITDNVDEFYEFYYELSELLQKYLKIENNKFTPTEQQKNKFQSDFINVGKYLGQLDKVRFNDLISKNSIITKDINVITLNYTGTLENILSISPYNTRKEFNNNIILRNVIHVHGRLGDSIIIGVDNETQIKNETLRNNDDVKEIMVKIESNVSMKETRQIECEKLIKEANVIVLFGVSLGETDSMWWRLIGKNLVERKNLIIIKHIYNPGVITLTQRQRIGKVEREEREYMLQRMEINKENQISNIKERLFFTINEPVFTVHPSLR